MMIKLIKQEAAYAWSAICDIPRAIRRNASLTGRALRALFTNYWVLCIIFGTLLLLWSDRQGYDLSDKPLIVIGVTMCAVSAIPGIKKKL